MVHPPPHPQSALLPRREPGSIILGIKIMPSVCAWFLPSQRAPERIDRHDAPSLLYLIRFPPGKGKVT
jgi:hypothetical protein